MTNGALRWEWHEHRWGVVIELEFTDEEQRELPRCALPSTRCPTGCGGYWCTRVAAADPVRACRAAHGCCQCPAQARPPEPYEEQSVRLS